jgi:hypothetical protein
LDAATGDIRLHMKGPGDRMLLSSGLLLAVDCGLFKGPGRGRWLVARSTKDGAVAFRVRLPDDDDWQPIREVVAGLFLVQINERPIDQGNALLIDRGGQVWLRLERQVLAVRTAGRDRLLATSRDVVRVSPEGRTMWAVAFPVHQSTGGGDLLELPGGDLISYLYDRNSDSGVQVMRLDPAKGKLVWAATCAPLAVSYSTYRHEATAAVDAGQIRIVSRGPNGTFVETLDLSTGRQLQRTTAGRNREP